MSQYLGSVIALSVLVLQACACPAPSPHAMAPSGARLFASSCAGCHGAAGRGNGPVADFLAVPVPDLTRIAQRRGGTFSEDEIFRIIDGQSERSTHGARHMPIWGYEYFGDDADDEVAHRQATEKVDRLVAYVRSLQRAD
jgi:mono/diheme cytochrome c family protein